MTYPKPKEGYVGTSGLARMMMVKPSSIKNMVDRGLLPACDYVITQKAQTFRYWKREKAETFASLYRQRHGAVKLTLRVSNEMLRDLDSVCEALKKTREEVVLQALSMVIA